MISDCSPGTGFEISNEGQVLEGPLTQSFSAVPDLTFLRHCPEVETPGYESYATAAAAETNRPRNVPASSRTTHQIALRGLRLGLWRCRAEWLTVICAACRDLSRAAAFAL